MQLSDAVVVFNFPYEAFFEGYGDGKKLTNLGKNFHKVREAVPNLPDDPSGVYSFTKYKANFSDIVSLCPGVQIHEIVDSESRPPLSTLIDRLTTQLMRITPEQNFNAKCDVHVPGFGLLSISEVTYVEDGCSDDIDQRLEEGWRIIAVCPQPDQRRPDYVLGRNNRGE